MAEWIEGEVTRDGIPVPGVQCILYDASGAYVATEVSHWYKVDEAVGQEQRIFSEGRFWFGGLAPGVYTVHFVGGGFEGTTNPADRATFRVVSDAQDIWYTYTTTTGGTVPGVPPNSGVGTGSSGYTWATGYTASVNWRCEKRASTPTGGTWSAPEKFVPPEYQYRIIVADSPPTGATPGDLWINTGNTPVQVWSRYDGADWTRLTPTGASEITFSGGTTTVEALKPHEAGAQVNAIRPIAGAHRLGSTTFTTMSTTSSGVTGLGVIQYPGLGNGSGRRLRIRLVCRLTGGGGDGGLIQAKVYSEENSVYLSISGITSSITLSAWKTYEIALDMPADSEGTVYAIRLSWYLEKGGLGDTLEMRGWSCYEERAS